MWPSTHLECGVEIQGPASEELAEGSLQWLRCFFETGGMRKWEISQSPYPPSFLHRPGTESTVAVAKEGSGIPSMQEKVDQSEFLLPGSRLDEMEILFVLEKGRLQPAQTRCSPQRLCEVSLPGLAMTL